MTDRQILFSAPMVLALLREARQPGTGKTQTRRILKPQPFHDDRGLLWWHWSKHAGSACNDPIGAVSSEWNRHLPYAVGDRLYVREAWTHDAADLDELRAKVEDAYPDYSYGPFYRATEPAPDTMRWRPSIHMPRRRSRLTLVVTDVRVERLNDISEADAKAEGIALSDLNWPTYRTNFIDLWNNIHGPESWAANPWIVAVSFRPILANIDTLAPPASGSDRIEGRPRNRLTGEAGT